MNEVGTRLAAWRAELRLTQAAFAMQIGIHVAQLKKYEQGRTMPGGDVLSTLATTGVNLHWLLTGQGEMRAPPAAAAGQAPAQPAAAAPVLTAVPSAGETGADEPVLHRYERRLQAFLGMLSNMPEQESAALLDEFAARASTQQQLSELRQAVQRLSAAKRKRA